MNGNPGSKGAALHPSPPRLGLPKGGGAIRGIGEKFAANPVTGTGSMSVPIAASPGRAGFGPRSRCRTTPAPATARSASAGASRLPAITRKTDKGLPRYGDGAESDVFVLSGAEDLVPELVGDAGDLQPRRETRAAFGAIYDVRRYRPRIEGLFARIERWTNAADPADTFWRSISRDNVTTWYGRTPESRIADPADPRRIFSWLICESYDDKGNVVSYDYKPEDAQGVDLTQLHERNRTERVAQRQPLPQAHPLRQPRAVLARPGRVAPNAAAHRLVFEVVFDYGEHDPDDPHPLQELQPWTRRDDPFSSYRAGFEVRTYRLCQRVLMFHHFAGEPEVGENCLVRSTDFDYAFEADPADARNPVYSFLARGHPGRLPAPRRRRLPTQRDAAARVRVQPARRRRRRSATSTPRVAAQPARTGVDGAGYRWVDLDGEGVPGVLTEQAERWFYKRNESPAAGTDDGDRQRRTRFGPVQVLSRPAVARCARRRPAVARPRGRRPARPRRARRAGARVLRAHAAKAAGPSTRRSRRCRTSTGPTRTCGSSISPATATPTS